MVYVKGANAETVETNPCQELLDDGVVQNVAQYYMKLHGLGQVEYHYGVMDNFYTIYLFSETSLGRFRGFWKERSKL